MSAIVNKAFRMFGFVKRTMKPFNNNCVFKVLYNSYIRSGLDYCSPVWSPNAKSAINKLERVQKKFVKHLCFLNRVEYNSSNYVDLCNKFQLTTLEKRRRITDIMLFYQVLHGKVNCPMLLSQIYFFLPSRRTRHTKVLTVKKKCRLQVRKNDYIPRSVTYANSLEQIDFFHRSLSKTTISCALSRLS